MTLARRLTDEQLQDRNRLLRIALLIGFGLGFMACVGLVMIVDHS